MLKLHVLKHMQKYGQTLAFNSPLYHWTLRGPIPDRLIVRPVDPWPGDALVGQALCEEDFPVEGGRPVLHGYRWEPPNVSEAQLRHMHGFTWLRDLQAFHQSGKHDRARSQAQVMISDWITHYAGWNKTIWAPALLGERIAMWISFYEFFGTSANDEFQDLFFESLGCQARHLSRAIPGNLYGTDLLHAAKGLLYAGLAFEGRKRWVEQALDIFETESDTQILRDGCHISRSPASLLNTLQFFLDVRTALQAGGYPLPEKIQYGIDRMGPALQFFRYHDKNLGLFNGTQEGNKAFIDCVLGQTGSKNKTLESLPCAGYERVAQGRTILMVDGGAPPSYPFDTRTHAAPLAFELSYAKDRVFVNCGTHPTDPAWKDALRATAAHNTLEINNRNICEIKSGGHLGRKPAHVHIKREDSKQASLIDATHDGYATLNGITHRRRLYLTDQGHNLRGEDSLTAAFSPPRPLDAALRFHLHPRVLVSLIADGEEALLRLPSGVGWRFKHAGGYLTLEDSVYAGTGHQPRKTKQLVLYAQIAGKSAKIQWGLRKEGS